MSGAVWLVTGAQASGKSTVADLLARRFERGMHVRGDQVRRWAVRGWVPFDDPDRAAARRDLELRYRLSAQIADECASAGFTVVVQDNVYGDDAVSWLDGLTSRPRHLVVLRPTVEVLAARDAARGKTAYSPTYGPAQNDADVATTPAHLGLWLDTSAMTPEAAVDAIVARASDAAIDG